MANRYRFRDDGRTNYDFADTFLVRCPQCHNCAKVMPLSVSDANSKPKLFDPRKLVCCSCGYNKIWHSNSLGGGDGSGRPTDLYFRLPLWLQTSCCGKILWAYNLDHLNFLEDYVQAAVREGPLSQAIPVSKNKTAASRLPAWIKSAKNRDEILKKIELLRKMLE